MKTLALRAAGFAFTVNLMLGSSFAGVVMQFEHKNPGGKTLSGSIELGADRVRANHGDQAIIFRGDKQLVWVLDPKQGHYTEMTKEQMKQMGAQMADAMAQMQEQLKNVPPEQRAMIEQMMQKHMPKDQAKPSEPLTFVKTGKSETINGFPCVAYDAMRGGKKQQQIWVTDWKKLGLTPKDFAVLEQMAEFFKDMVGPIAKQFSMGIEQKYTDTDSPNALPGVPIRIVSSSDSGESVMEIKKISHEDVAASEFEVPAGLKKQDMSTPKMEMKVQPKADEDGD